MSRSALVRRTFAGDVRTFALTIGSCEELQDLTDDGLTVTLEKVTSCSVRHIAHVLRLGLIGHGMDGERAEGIVARGLTPGSILEAAVIAAAILEAALKGAPDEPLGEAEGEGEPTTPGHLSPAASIDTPISTG